MLQTVLAVVLVLAAVAFAVGCGYVVLRLYRGPDEGSV
jgi:hypothetical protein